jgi:RimJ/RimL family protein N-acetyltransferase/ribosomal protein S18 acetylase RimI-like enzyme
MSDTAVTQADRIRAFRRRLEEATAERREPFAHGVGLFSDSISSVYDANYLVLNELATVEVHAAEADELMERFHHRKVVAFEGGLGLAQGFAELGWTLTTHLVMAQRREPDRLVDTSSVREVTHEELGPVKRATTLAEAWGTEQLAEQLREAKRRVGAAVSLRFFAAFVDGELAAYCELRSDGRTAQIEDVETLTEFRGRGLGRAVVQFTLEEARRTHDLVFLEALEDHWPRELYAKLGFDIVDERHLLLHTGHPLTGLRLRTPRLELRLATVAELRELAAVALAGIHDPAEMPFEFPWTDTLTEESFVVHHQELLKEWRAESWRLNLIAFQNGHPIGSQGIGSERFAESRTVATGSWLGRPFQGQGLGTEMRAAVLHFAFAGLGAAKAISGAIARNPQSLGVSRKLGYVETGGHTVAPRGEPLEHTDLELRLAQFHSPVPVEIEGLDALRSHFGIATLA